MIGNQPAALVGRSIWEILANGNVLRVVRALIAAHKANIDLSFEKAAVIDLAGQDAEDLVKKESGSCGG